MVVFGNKNYFLKLESGRMLYVMRNKIFERMEIMGEIRIKSGIF